jgi:hypothetical protein
MFNKFFTLSLSAFIALAFSAMSFGQATLFEDDFDSYTAGLQLACQNPVGWTTWSLTPCGADDPLVSSAQSSSSPNSVNIILNNDLLKLFPALYTTGKYSMSWEMYIPTGLTGYFNCLSSWNSGSPAWAMQVYFNQNGMGNMDAGGALAQAFTYTHDVWMDVEVICDLDLDIGEFWLDGVMIYTWQWSLGTFGTGELSLEANNFFGGGTDGVPDYYFDNYALVDLNAPPPTTNFFDDMEAYTPGTGLACQNPIEWDTWSNLPCDPGEDPLVSSAFAYSGSNSTVIVSGNDLIRHHNDLTSGTWYMSFQMYIPTGASGYFNLESDFAVYWAVEIYFDVGGAGRVLTGDPQVDFTWTENSWQLAQVVVDLDSDLAQFWFNGVMIASWAWTNGTSTGTGPLALDVTDFFGAAATDQMYFDDFWFGDVPVPVELTSFAANVNNNGDVILNWTTASELNNQLFEIERRSEEGQYLRIGYVEGHGTTTEAQEYSYIDNTVETGTYFYRLKQIDFLGTYEYSDEVEVEVNGPLTFNLEQNYPNPFNPSTNIKYNIPESGIVKLAIYNTLGEEVAVLVDGMVQAGFYEVTFDASSLPSGAYFYRLQSDNLNQVKKMLLMK